MMHLIMTASVGLLYDKELETKVIDFTMGPSYMEDDVREKHQDLVL